MSLPIQWTRRKAGLCPTCGVVPEPPYRYCATCRAKAAARQRRCQSVPSRVKYRAAGLCPRCGRLDPAWLHSRKYILCLACRKATSRAMRERRA